MRAAFIYYLKNHNHGRPIIIASHSQGTWHAGRLLKEFFEGKPLQTVTAYVTNPLSWTIDTAFEPSELNKRGMPRNFNKLIPGLVHAQVHGDVLWVNKPKFFGSIFLKIKNYHIADYNLFYDNIRENVGTRIRAFLQGQ